jgi:Dihydroxynaphthoic acid synthase
VGSFDAGYGSAYFAKLVDTQRECFCFFRE